MLTPILLLCQTVRLFLAALEENEIQIMFLDCNHEVSVFSRLVIFIKSLDSKFLNTVILDSLSVHLPAKKKKLSAMGLGFLSIERFLICNNMCEFSNHLR